MHVGRYAAHVSGSKGISKLFDVHPDLFPTGDTSDRFCMLLLVGEILERWCHHEIVSEDLRRFCMLVASRSVQQTPRLHNFF
jgi:hypothetical protein